MDNKEAVDVLESALARYRAMTYSELATHVGHRETNSVPGESRRLYQVQIQIAWDAKPGGDIRVLGAVDDGGWRSFIPVTTDFLVEPAADAG